MTRTGGAVAIVAALTLVTVGAAALWPDEGSEASADNAQPATSTVTVAREDLVVHTDTDATLTYTSSLTLGAPVEATVTGAATAGDVLDRGSTVALLDGTPAVLLIGDVPAWRDLEPGVDEGVDVLQLEQNLVSMGFDPDGTIEIDENYDADTGDAVERWEDSLGLDGDDTVALAELVFAPGSVLVETVDAPTGTVLRGGAAMVTGRIVDRRFDVASTASTGGVVGSILAPGEPVDTATVLFFHDGLPVVAAVDDLAATSREARDLALGVADGADVEVLETILATARHDASGALVVDDHFDTATEEALQSWWRELGVAEELLGDPEVPAGSIVSVPPDLEVGAVEVDDGSSLTSDTVVLALTEPSRSITVDVGLDDETFALAAVVEVIFPDHTTVAGVVTDIGDVPVRSDQPGQQATIDVRIEVDGEIPEALSDFLEVPVTVRVVSDQVIDALTVPVSALVALAEGGYAVEVVEATGAAGAALTRLVAVEPGLFVDGSVEVVGALAVGDTVVVP